MSCLPDASLPRNGADMSGSEDREMLFNKRQNRVAHPDSTLFEQGIVPKLKELEYQAR
jgi:hypothetical protein